MYSTISAWNADESRLILFDVAAGHQLYDGRTYEFIKPLDISPADIEQVYWHTARSRHPLLRRRHDLIRYHVGAGTKEALTTFDFCVGGASGGSDPMFISWGSERIGLGCGIRCSSTTSARNRCSGEDAERNPAQVAPSGHARLSERHRPGDDSASTTCARSTGRAWGHASLGGSPNGHDTWNGAVYDPGRTGSDIGSLVTWDLADGDLEGDHRPEDRVALSRRRRTSRRWPTTAGMGRRLDVGDTRARAARPRDADRRHDRRQGLPHRPPPELGKANPSGRALLGRAAHRAEPERHAQRSSAATGATARPSTPTSSSCRRTE